VTPPNELNGLPGWAERSEPAGTGFADLHSHLLPGVDDGSRSVEQSLATLAQMREAGVHDVCLTPHFSAALLYPDLLRERLEMFQESWKDLSSAAENLPRLHRGVELMLNIPLDDAMILDRRFTLAGSRYLLVEFQNEIDGRSIRALLAQVVERGLTPLVAHPERYLSGTPEEVFKWRDVGAVVQVDATTLFRGTGSRGKRARAIVEQGLADILAADNHGEARTIAGALPLFEETDEEDSIDAADTLLRSNPLAVLRDQALDAVPAVRFKRNLVQQIRSLFASDR
jgi:protein-tyrosine phosphatase